MILGAAVYVVILKKKRIPRKFPLDYAVIFIVTLATLASAWSGWYATNQLGEQTLLSSDDQFLNGLVVNLCGLFSAMVVLHKFLPQRYEALPEKALPQARMTQNAKTLIGMLAKIAKAGGGVSQAELDVVTAFIKADMKYEGELLDTALACFHNAKNAPETFSSYLAQYSAAKGDNSDVLVSVIMLMVDIANADGRIDASELKLLRQAAESFGHSGFLDRLLGQISPIRAHATPAQQDTSSSILDISEGASLDDINRAYKSKAQHFSSDKTSHLSKSLQKFSQDEANRLKSAYDDLKNRTSKS